MKLKAELAPEILRAACAEIDKMIENARIAGDHHRVKLLQEFKREYFEVDKK